MNDEGLPNPFAKPRDLARSGNPQQRPRVLQVLTLRGEPFEVDEVCRGGMGEILLGSFRSNPERRLALKTFSSDRRFDRESQLAFQREISLWFKMADVPFVFPPLGLEFIVGRPYILMPAVQPDASGAVSVRDLLQRHPEGLPFAEVLQIVLPVTLALNEGQKVAPGFTHGDLKPDNLLLYGGIVHISDFGVAATMKPDDQAQVLPGTWAYSAPELWDRAVGPSVATDIYAFGIVLYELITGSKPFIGSSEATWQEAHMEQEPKSPGSSYEKPGLIELLQLVNSCMAKRPESRPADFKAIFRQVAAVGDKYDRPLVARLLWNAAVLTGPPGSEKEQAKAHVIRISALLESRQPEEALELIQRLPARERTPEIMVLQGSALSLIGHDEQAITSFEEALRNGLDPDTRQQCRNELGLTYKRLKRHKDAISLFQDLLPEVSAGMLPIVTVNLAGTYLEDGQAETALRYLEPFVKRHPDEAGAWDALAIAYEKLSRFQDAVQSYRRALAADPGRADTRIWLAKILMDQFGRAEEAFRELDRAFDQGYEVTRDWMVRMIACATALGRSNVVTALMGNLRRDLSSKDANALEQEALQRTVELMKRMVGDDPSSKE